MKTLFLAGATALVLSAVCAGCAKDGADTPPIPAGVKTATTLTPAQQALRKKRGG